jgi:Fur family transcriptional regulator, ferric uptake regulator
MAVPDSMETDVEHIHEMVRAAGGRLTVPTRTVISILASSDAHLTAEDVIAAVDERIVGVSPSTIYRVIQRLGELDVIEHVHSGNGPAFYHLREHGHAHLVCNSCGIVIDLPDAVFDGLAKVALDEYGFSVDAHHSALLGLCERCAPLAQ